VNVDISFGVRSEGARVKEFVKASDNFLTASESQSYMDSDS
jgi:hypothetical protein